AFADAELLLGGPVDDGEAAPALDGAGQEAQLARLVELPDQPDRGAIEREGVDPDGGDADPPVVQPHFGLGGLAVDGERAAQQGGDILDLVLAEGPALDARGGPGGSGA